MFLEYFDGTSWIPLGSLSSPITLTGFVKSSPSFGVLHTERGDNTFLSTIPAGGDLNLEGFMISNLASPQSDHDAVNFEFMWQLMNDEVV